LHVVRDQHSCFPKNARHDSHELWMACFEGGAMDAPDMVPRGSHQLLDIGEREGYRELVAYGWDARR